MFKVGDIVKLPHFDEMMSFEVTELKDNNIMIIVPIQSQSRMRFPVNQRSWIFRKQKLEQIMKKLKSNKICVK